MRNVEHWRPTRWVSTKRGYRASKDPDRVALTSRFIANTAIDAYVPLIRAHARGKLLDLGCGLVPYYGVYGDRVQGCVCVDWPATLHDNPHLDAHVDLNTGLPFRDAQFDTVLLSDVLEHIARPEPLMKEIARTLKPGGRVLVFVPFFYGLHEQPHDYYRYTEHALRRFCDVAGLAVEHLEPYGGAPEIFMDLTTKNVVFSKVLTRTLAGFFGWLRKRWPVRGMSRSTARVFPLGYCLVAARPDAPQAPACTKPVLTAAGRV